MAAHTCEAPDCSANSGAHPAYQRFGYFVAVAPKKAYWFYVCEDYIRYLRNEIAMGRTQLVIMKARSLGL